MKASIDRVVSCLNARFGPAVRGADALMPLLRYASATDRLNGGRTGWQLSRESALREVLAESDISEDSADDNDEADKPNNLVHSCHPI
jgi:hypothetical protein